MITNIILIAVIFHSIYLGYLLIKKRDKEDKSKRLIYFMVGGMALGLVGGGLLFYSLDNTKGWNPFGWWFLATFLTAILSAILSIIAYGYFSRNRQ